MLSRLLLPICFASLICAATQSYVTEDFLAPSLSYKKTGTTEPGYLFIGPSGKGADPQAPIIITDENELVWNGGHTEDIGPQDFRVQQYNGQDVLVYWNGFGSLLGGGLGQVNIFDNTYKRLFTICPKDILIYYAGYVKKDCPLDLHEMYITDKGTILITGYNLTTADLTSVGGPKNGHIFDAMFFEIDIVTQNVLFSWRATDHLKKLPFTASHHPLEAQGPDSAQSPWDWFHINTVQPVDGGYMINSRFLWTVMIINNDGNIRWRLEGSNGGDFSIDPGFFFSYAHHGRINSNDSGLLTYTLFNNDNERPPAGVNVSTGLEFLINENTRKVTSLRRLTDPKDPIVAQAQGSVQLLNNSHVFVGFGSEPTVKEFDQNGAVVYSATFGGARVNGYRSYRLPWVATPYYPPKTVGNLTTTSAGVDKLNVWMSWNGATEITGWRIYYGPKRANLRVLDTITKTGFETKYTSTKTPNFVMVEAMDGKVGVRNSTIVRTSDNRTNAKQAIQASVSTTTASLATASASTASSATASLVTAVNKVVNNTVDGSVHIVGIGRRSSRHRYGYRHMR